VTTVLVTGAAGDIGAAIAVRLASTGTDVILADHPEASAQLAESADDCRGRGGEIRTLPFDVTDERATGTAIHDSARIDGLVNAAGVQGSFAPIDSYALDDARRVFDVNVLGLFTVLAAVSRHMIETRSGGSIVNLASMAGVTGAPNMPAYSASKAAVIGLTKAAAKDLAPAGIRVNAVSPGPLATRAASGLADFDALLDDARRRAPMRRLVDIGEIGALCPFLAGDGARSITGGVLYVDGGHHILSGA